MKSALILFHLTVSDWGISGVKMPRHNTTSRQMYDIRTFQEVVRPEAFTILDIFDHVVSKLVHMSGCPWWIKNKEISNTENVQHLLLDTVFKIINTNKNVSATGLWKAAIVTAPMHKIAESICASKSKPRVQHSVADCRNHKALN